MDVGSSLDVQCFVGAGLEKTISYLQSCNDHVSQKICSYIKEEFDSGYLEALPSWEAHQSAYFGRGIKP